MGEVTAPLTPPAKGAKSQSFLRDLVRRLIRERPVGAVSAAIIVLLCLVAIFADVLAPFHFMDMTMIDRLQGPSSTYPLGTDHIGRDVLSRLLYGARVSLGVGSAATTLSVLESLLIGGVAGFVGGKLDLAVQRFVDAWMSFPGLLLRDLLDPRLRGGDGVAGGVGARAAERATKALQKLERSH